MSTARDTVPGLAQVWARAAERAIETDAVSALQIISGAFKHALDLAHGQDMADAKAAQAAATAGTLDASLGVPANLALVKADVTDADRALLTFTWDAVDGANEYWVYHEFGNPYMPDQRLAAKVPACSVTIGGTPPFLVAPGAPYTIAVYAAAGGAHAPVPAVLEVHVPPYVAQSPAAVAFPEPFAWAPGTVENDSLVAPILVGAPGSQKQQVSFRRTKTQDIADSGAYSIVIDPATAQMLGLPNNGPVDVSGVGGGATGYATEIDLEFPGNGTRVYGQYAVVISTFQECLIGFMFAVERGLVMCEDSQRGVLSYFKASDFWAPPTAATPTTGA